MLSGFSKIVYTFVVLKTKPFWFNDAFIYVCLSKILALFFSCLLLAVTLQIMTFVNTINQIFYATLNGRVSVCVTLCMLA